MFASKKVINVLLHRTFYILNGLQKKMFYFYSFVLSCLWRIIRKRVSKKPVYKPGSPFASIYHLSRKWKLNAKEGSEYCKPVTNFSFIDSCQKNSRAQIKLTMKCGLRRTILNYLIRKSVGQTAKIRPTPASYHEYFPSS